MLLKNYPIDVIRRLSNLQTKMGSKSQPPLTAKTIELKNHGRRYSDRFDFAGTGYFTLDHNGKIRRGTPRGARILGGELEDLLNRSFREYVAADDQRRFDMMCKQAVEDLTRQSCDLKLSKDGRRPHYVQIEGMALKDKKGSRHHIQIAVAEITDRKRAEEALCDALEKSQQHAREVSALLDGSRAVLQYREFKDSARFIFDSCKDLIGAKAGYVALLSKDGSENELLHLDAGGLTCTVDPALSMPIRGLREQAYRTRKTVLDNNPSQSEFAEFLPGGHARLESLLFAPLVIKNKAVGLLGLANKPAGFTENDARIASGFGEFAAMALYNSQTLESLEHSEQRFRSVVETAIDAIITIDQRGKIIFWNRQAEQMFGYSRTDIIGQPATVIMPQRYHKAHRHSLREIAAMEHYNVPEKIRELDGLKKDGSEFPLELSLAKWDTAEGSFFTAIVRDISERKQAETALQTARGELEKRVIERTAELAETNKELRQRIAECEFAQSALKESELKYSTLVEDALIGVYIAQDDRIVFANDKFAEIYAYPKQELIGMDSLNLVHPEDRAMVKELREKRLKGEKVPSEYEIRGLKKNGETIWVMRSYSLIHYDGKPAISGIVADMTTRRLAEDALRKSDKELRILSNQLLSTEEKERKRMARELHDGIGQSLSAIKFSVENTLRELHDRADLTALASLQTVIPITQKTIEEVRRIVEDLRPSILDDLGILATITWFCREFQTVYSNIRIERRIDISEADIPLPLKTAIYRVLQEALNNVAKHSRADRVQLSVTQQDHEIVLAIKDNGDGFDLEGTLSLTPSQRGFGLASMRERVELSGARFDIRSQIGDGTTIEVVWDGA
jgi:PAS domain S-box-containing protein